MSFDLPKSMLAMAISKPGGPDVLVAEKRDVPKPTNTEILVKVEAAGVNRPDVMQRLGLYPPPKDASDLPGLEVAGIVAAKGEQATHYEIGDKVCALTPGGGYAEYCLVDETNALPIPGNLSMLEAAALPETFFTVWHNVFDRAYLTEGEYLLVHGGTSGIGTTAIQMATQRGAKVIVTAGSDEKCKFCENLGAVRAINYLTEDFITVTKEVTNKHGADVILDMVGGDYIERNFHSAAMDGRIVQIAFMRGASADTNFGQLMRKRLTHTGSTLRPRSIEFKADIALKLRKEIWPLVASGAIRPIIDSSFELTDVVKAHERMESSQHIGKIMLTV